MNVLSQALTLPVSKQVLKNRIIKSCMSDSLGDGKGNPTQEQIRLYERWAMGDAAMCCIGEVQIDPQYPEKPGNLVLLDVKGEEPTSTMNATMFQELTKRGATNGCHIWPQIGHAGALSYEPIHKPKGPSKLTITDPNDKSNIVLDCDSFTIDEVQELPTRYAKAAKIIQRLGFTGVLIHAGHGFLLSQFLCPLFNKRTDEYGSQSITSRSKIVIEIVKAVRQAVGTTRIIQPTYCYGHPTYCFFDGNPDTRFPSEWT